MKDIEIQRAHAGHIEGVVGLMQRAYRGEESRQGWTSEADLIDGDRTSPSEIAAILDDPNQILLVATSPSSGLIGCAVISRIDPSLGGASSTTCLFGKFAVEPKAQGGGLGKILLAAAEAAASTEFHAQTMQMTVVEQRHELIAFYKRRGYFATGNRVLMADIHEDASMTKGHDLVLLEFEKDLTL
jgi:GNAT superfamily N-acetyltransferase